MLDNSKSLYMQIEATVSNDLENQEISKSSIFNIPEQMDILTPLKGKFLVKNVCDLFNETQRLILEAAYKEVGHEEFLLLVRKSMEIQNNGGQMKLTDNKPKSTGGILMKLIRTQTGLSKPQIKSIFSNKISTSKSTKSEKRARRKVIQSMRNLEIDD